MLLSGGDIRSHMQKGKVIQDLIDADKQIQQCGVDLTVGKIFTLEGEGVIDFDNQKRKTPDYKEIPLMEGAWVLQPGTYHFALNEKLVLPKNIAGLAMPRSSALMCGIEIHTAVWDPGYEGRGFIHASISRPVKIHKNARVSQMIFFDLGKDAGSYEGKYKSEDVLKFAKRGFE